MCIHRFDVLKSTWITLPPPATKRRAALNSWPAISCLEAPRGYVEERPGHQTFMIS
eukprot:Skav231274  [mRNA]  locus=scaffold161:20015:25221:+ [translate_table: standard]